MDDLERVIRQNVESGPLVTGSLEDYGIEPHRFATAVPQNLTPAQRQIADHWTTNWSFKEASDLYLEEYELKISRDVFNDKMFKQFQISFNRELRTLPPEASGELMAKFATPWALKPPAFTSDLVYFAWASDRTALAKINKLATLTIWKTGNARGIAELLPSLSTNRMGGFTLAEDFKTVTGAGEPHPSYNLEGWKKKWPKQTAEALAQIQDRLKTGDLARPTFLFPTETDHFWSAAPNREIENYFKSEMPACPVAFGKLGKR